ncbi:MAG: hypothetical protein HY459_02060 [Parcubacteria group bacterium]|nr:hypothetical protein [Parcubacteria group bacterium]
MPSLTERDGVVHTTMPYRVDLVFVAGEKVVGVELKRGEDLVTSAHVHRLGRQLIVLGQTCDVVVLGISQFESIQEEVALELVAYQVMGVIVAMLPSTYMGQVAMLASIKPYLDGSRSVLAPFRWTDLDLRPRRTRVGWLLRDIPGVGDVLARRLLDRFGSVMVALGASEEEWRECGATRRAIEGRREALL